MRFDRSAMFMAPVETNWPLLQFQSVVVSASVTSNGPEAARWLPMQFQFCHLERNPNDPEQSEWEARAKSKDPGNAFLCYAASGSSLKII
ncbi:MAG TPA: hypothetical protein VFB79_16975 [Candidatus Angelobacter sp.]|nr:hypothetical protein [Candidatus Angelobacter sp.]